MNNCVLMAEIVQAPQLRYTSDTQTPIAEFVVQFPGLRPDDAPGQIKVTGWGNLAQEIQSQYKVNDRVLLEGRLSMNTMERPEGFKEKRAEMTVQRIHGISALQSEPLAAPVMDTGMGGMAAASSPPAAAAAPLSAPATAAPEPTVPNYDDIPF